MCLCPDLISPQLHQNTSVNEKAPESQRSTFVKQLKLGKVALCHCQPRMLMKRLKCCSHILSLSALASPVSLHPFTKTDMVQRRNPEKTGARAAHRVSVNGQLQTQCFHTEEDQTFSKSHSDRKLRQFCGKTNYQQHWCVGIFRISYWFGL